MISDENLSLLEAKEKLKEIGYSDKEIDIIIEIKAKYGYTLGEAIFHYSKKLKGECNDS